MLLEEWHMMYSCTSWCSSRRRSTTCRYWFMCLLIFLPSDDTSVLLVTTALCQTNQGVHHYNILVCVCVCVWVSWFTASPGLSQTGYTLGLGEAAHLWCRAIISPRINQLSPHTLEERATVMAACTILPSPINAFSTPPQPVSEGPSKSHWCGVWQSLLLQTYVFKVGSMTKTIECTNDDGRFINSPPLLLR